MRMIQNGIHSDVQRLKSSSVNVNRLSGEHTVNAYDDIFDTALSSDVYRLNNSDNSFLIIITAYIQWQVNFLILIITALPDIAISVLLFQQDRVHR